MAIGTWQAYTTEAVETTLRDQVILPKLSDLITELMEKEKITILKLAPYYDEIGTYGKAKILDDFTSYGLELVRFAVESINVPQEDESVKRLKKALADKAEIGIMGQDDYKMKRTFDTMEKAAGSDGMSGGMMGAGMGVGMGQQMAGMMGQAMGGATQSGKVACPHCNAQNQPGAKFCASCGKEMAAGMNCPKCKAKIPLNSKFCPECGANLEGGKCVKCGAKMQADAKFCPECGAQQG